MTPWIVSLMLAAASPQPTPQAAVQALKGMDVAPAVLPGLDRLPRPGPGMVYMAERTSRARELKISAWRHRRRVAEVQVILPPAVPRSMWVPRTELSAGQPIQGKDLVLRTVEMVGPVGPYASEPEQLVGRVPKRSLPAERPVRIESLTAPKVVHRGRPVRMFVRRGGLVVEATGQALTSGGLHQVVRVMNNQSNRVVFATVTAPGEVEVR